MPNRDLSRNEARVLRGDRKVDRRQGILPEVDPRQNQLQTFGDMRTARRGSGGAEGILRSLGMLEDGLGNAQRTAQAKFAIEEEDNYEQALLDHMTGSTSEERMGRSEAYRRGLGMAQTETRWFEHKTAKDLEFQEFLEQQQEPTLEGRLKSAAEWIEKEYFGSFVKDPETGEVIDMGHKDGYLLALGQVQKSRPVLLAAAGQRITARFEGEALNLFQTSVRNRVLSGEPVNIAELIDRVPPSVPQEQVTAAYLNTVTSITGELERQGRHQEGVALLDQALGLAEASLPPEERSGIVSFDPGPSSVASVPEGAAQPAPADFDIGNYMGRNRSAESSGNDTAAAATSSAYGRYQFLKGTWLQSYRQTFGDTGESEAQILAKRADGATQDKVMETFTRQNVEKLQKNGVAVNDATVYLMHFLGEGDALKVLKADPNANIGDLVSRSSRRANSSVFSGVRNAGQLVAWAERKMGAEPGSTPAAVPPGDPSYTPNGLPRSVRDRAMDPTAQLIPELEGRFAANAEQRQLLLQQREALVKRWDAFEDEERARISTETSGAFALRLIGNGPPLTRIDITKAHREGRLSDVEAAKWFESLQAHERGEEAYRQSQADRAEAAEQQRIERTARSVIGVAAFDYFSKGGDPRNIITSVMGSLHLIEDPIVRAETAIQAGRLAEGMENLNLSTPAVQTYQRNVKRTAEVLGSKLPPGTRLEYVDPQGKVQRVTREEAAKMAEAQLGRLSLEALTDAASGEAPNWADTQSELQNWMVRSFRAPTADASNSLR